MNLEQVTEEGVVSEKTKVEKEFGGRERVGEEEERHQNPCETETGTTRHYVLLT